MNAPLTEEEKIARAARAAAILNDSLFKDGLAGFKQEIVDRWAMTPVRDTEGREWLWALYQGALKFEEAFVQILNTGKMAEDAIKRQRKVTAMEKLTNYWSRNNAA